MTKMEIQNELTAIVGNRWVVSEAYEADWGMGFGGFFIRFDDFPDNAKATAFVKKMGDAAIMTDKGFLFRA